MSDTSPHPLFTLSHVIQLLYCLLATNVKFLYLSALVALVDKPWLYFLRAAY
uniref:Uncharacterized protein n=1 Tax=Arundo donax TaxID=35708 RepID=A0A0A9E925_ARUDO